MNNFKTDLSGAVVVLGSPNDPNGRLSLVALSRINLAIPLCNQRSASSLILTGGFGASFNLSQDPHSTHLRRYVESHPSWTGGSAILECSQSSNTVEDALGVRSVLETSGNHICVVTSDYHIERSELIFNALLPDLTIEMVSVPAPISDEERAQLEQHEQHAITALKKQGGIFIDQGGSQTLIPFHHRQSL